MKLDEIATALVCFVTCTVIGYLLWEALVANNFW